MKSTSTQQHRCETCILRTGKHELVIKSEPANLSMVRNQVKLIGEHCSLSGRQLFDLQVAVGEATANAVEHGSPRGPENRVCVTTSCNGDALTIAVKDEGKFKRSMPNPGIELSFRGRGIPLMLALMDKVIIDEAKDGTCIILVKHINCNGDCPENKGTDF